MTRHEFGSMIQKKILVSWFGGSRTEFIKVVATLFSSFFVGAFGGVAFNSWIVSAFASVSTFIVVIGALYVRCAIDECYALSRYERGSSETVEKEPLQLMHAKSLLLSLSEWLDDAKRNPPTDVAIHQEMVRSVYAGLLRSNMRSIGIENPTNAQIVQHLWSQIMVARTDIKESNYDKNWNVPEWLTELDRKRLEA